MKHFEQFLKMNEGKWLTQSTIYDLNTNNKISFQSQIISKIEHSNSKQIDLESILNSEDNYFTNSISVVKNNIRETSVNYFLNPQYDQEIKGYRGKFIRYNTSIDVKSILEGYFVLQADGSFILNSKYKDLQIYEKYQFISNNLRLYINITKQFGFSIITAFNSDIRI